MKNKEGWLIKQIEKKMNLKKFCQNRDMQGNKIWLIRKKNSSKKRLIVIYYNNRPKRKKIKKILTENYYSKKEKRLKSISKIWSMCLRRKKMKKLNFWIKRI